MGGSSSTLDNKDTITKVNPPSDCPMHAQELPTKKVDQNANYQSDCPMSQGENRACPVKNDGGDEIDPLNMMPPPNQRPSEGQPFPLPTGRVTSTIPKAGTEETWQYPSQQMFWNAMLRKGWKWKDEEITPGAMESIITIHNANNEQAWREVLKWEAMHACECSEPKLKKFGGKATQYSPRSRVRSWLGYELPFDRHDWIVDRCGRDVRYIIDYYNGGDVDEKSNEFTILDVRPAFDSFTAFKDRMKVHYMRWTAKNDDVNIGGTVVNHRKPSVAS